VLVDELCGIRYARDKERKFKMAVRRTIFTRHGKIEFMVIKVKSLENGSVIRSSSTSVWNHKGC